MSARVPVEGGCHCGAVRFRAEADAAPKMLHCNCSICSASGYLHLFIPHERFELLSGDEALTSYRFGSGQAVHLFCRICGVKSFYQPKSHPDCWSVHLACLDDASNLTPEITEFDGKNWEQAADNVLR
ncbi:GFA family protein [uncultured Erythrobacter sp.]|uniref:GFA family protein n=1 Tax=uncultured Erythrobacter sp. TaxID=263913 RepID=UPI002635D845|nr:GFA family protein [uncultured Erythrobacter sp.]